MMIAKKSLTLLVATVYCLTLKVQYSSLPDTPDTLADFPRPATKSRDDGGVEKNLKAVGNNSIGIGIGVNATRNLNPKPTQHPQLSCKFREYGHSSYYGLIRKDYPQPFFQNSTYVFGKLPALLPVPKRSHGNEDEFLDAKVCRRPLAHKRTVRKPWKWQRKPKFHVKGKQPDGSNPSLLSLQDLLDSPRRNNISFPLEEIRKDFPTAMYLATTSFKTNHGCFRVEDDWYKETLRGRTRIWETDLHILDSNMNTLLYTTLRADGDEEEGEPFESDDARVLFHDGAIWMLFKRYLSPEDRDHQMLAQLRFEYINDQSSFSQPPQFHAFLFNRKSICCGRNFMALESDGTSSQLSLVTFPDPVWVQTIDTKNQSTTQYNLTDPGEDKVIGHFHGTSGTMLYSQETDEFFGTAHIHRDIDEGTFVALYGHHYSHVFFSISSKPPFSLLRLSEEFLFPSKSPKFSSDADAIQFASGLAWAPGRQKVVIGYGINDCETAMVEVNWKDIDAMLAPVQAGMEIDDALRKPDIRELTNWTTSKRNLESDVATHGKKRGKRRGGKRKRGKQTQH